MELLLGEKLSELEERMKQSYTEASHSIYKVPTELSDVNNKAYVPEAVAIGPYYHGKHELKQMEEVKLQSMKSLLHRKREVPLQYYFSEIAEIEKVARNCYAEDVGLNEVDFIEMLVLDGCLIIELISENAFLTPRLKNSLSRDLILLENQIPFFVLEKLYYIVHGNMDDLIKRILSFFWHTIPWDLSLSTMLMSRLAGVKHLLDLVYSSCTDVECASPYEIKRYSDLHIPCVAQLKDANVNFKKKVNDPHPLRGTAVFDVEFKKDKGVMVMPYLIVDGNTESLLRNLIAHEQYCLSNTNTNTPFTDYAFLLSCLITSPKDVQILSQHGIIENSLGSNEEVCNFINQLTCKIVYYGENFTYGGIIHRINTYMNRRRTTMAMSWNRASGDFRETYFRSPWSFISVVAASVLLLLTIAQTVFAALQYFQDSA